MSILSHAPLAPLFERPSARKRAPAFDEAPARRARRRLPPPAPERPAWLAERLVSPRLDARLDGSTALTVVHPDGRTECAALLPACTLTVLVFMGAGGAATLAAVGAVRALLAEMGARAYGVALADTPAGAPLPIGSCPFHPSVATLADGQSVRYGPGAHEAHGPAAPAGWRAGSAGRRGRA